MKNFKCKYNWTNFTLFKFIKLCACNLIQAIGLEVICKHCLNSYLDLQKYIFQPISIENIAKETSTVVIKCFFYPKSMRDLNSLFLGLLMHFEPICIGLALFVHYKNASGHIISLLA